MEFTSLLSVIACLALLLSTGFIGGKAKILDETSTERLSTLIVKIGQPFLIINSIITQKCTPEKLRTGLMFFVLGLLLQVGMWVIAFFASKPFKRADKKKLAEFAMFFSNCGFMGFPVIESLYGEDGLFYGAFYIMSFHLLTWTLGLFILSRGRDDIKITPVKILVNYGTIPCLIGFAIFVSGLPIPGFIRTLTSYLGGLCTPISMLITGANIARRSVKKMLTDPKIYYTAAFKLVVMPIAAATVLWLVGLPDIVVIFGTVMAAMPSAAMVTMFAELYHISPGFAAEIVGTSSLFSTVTIVPVVSYAMWLCSLR